MNRIIIGLTGDTGVGKTTLAEYMVMAYGFTHIAFADQNRKEVADNWGFDVRNFDAYPFKDTLLDQLTIAGSKDEGFVKWFNIQPGAFYNYQSNTPRQLQLLWSDYKKSIHGKNYYIDIVERELLKPGTHHFIVSDVRSPDEAEFIHRLGNRTPYEVSPYVVRIVCEGINRSSISHKLHEPLHKGFLNFTIENLWDKHLLADAAEHAFGHKVAGFKKLMMTRRDRLDGCIRNIDRTG